MQAADHHESVRRNRLAWGRLAARYAEEAPRLWASDTPTWGIWGIPESTLHALPEVSGRDVVELGCGTAYWSAWLARRGARPIGVDPTAEQLTTARAMQHAHGIFFPLLQASGEHVPLADACADVVLSEYGAAMWADPLAWVPEASRLLRPGGTLVFMKQGILLTLCAREWATAGRELLRPLFGMHRLEWADEDGAVQFNLPTGGWVRLLRGCGLVVEDLIEVQPPADAATRYDFVDLEWARAWPSEEIWRARKPHR